MCLCVVFFVGVGVPPHPGIAGSVVGHEDLPVSDLPGDSSPEVWNTPLGAALPVDLVLTLIEQCNQRESIETILIWGLLPLNKDCALWACI